MRKEKLEDGNRYGCSVSASGDRVLLQLDDAESGAQVRVSLTEEEAVRVAGEIVRLAVGL